MDREERDIEAVEERAGRPPRPLKKGFYRKYVILGLLLGIMVYGSLLAAVLSSVIFFFVDMILNKEKGGFSKVLISVIVAMLLSGILSIIFQTIATSIGHVDIKNMSILSRWILFGGLFGQ